MRIKSPLKTVFNVVAHRAPIEAQVIITRHCNLSCGYCTEYDKVSKPVPVETLKTWLDVLHRLRVVNIALLGGEPLLHPDLPEIVAYANRHSQVSLTTNGYLLKPKLIHALNDAGLSNLQISIDALHRDRSGFIQKTLEQIWPKLELLKREAKFDIHTNVVLCPETKSTFLETAERLHNLGCTVSVGLLHDGNGQAAIEGEDFQEIWANHFKKFAGYGDIDTQYGLSLLQGDRPQWKCRAGSRFLYVDEFGKVRYCSSQRGRWGKPITELTEADLREQHQLNKGCESGCSLLCVYRASQLDNAPIKTVTGLARTLTKGSIQLKK